MVTTNRSTRHVSVAFCCAILLAVLCPSESVGQTEQAPDTQKTQKQRRKRAPVSWVNARLPAGPGLTHHVLASQAMGHDVGYVVWTPKDFDNSGAIRYAAVYFLHGMGGNESSDSAGFSGLLAKAVSAGELKPVIAVFPNGGRSGYSGSVESMIVDELIPLIDKQYPTQATAAGRVVAGFSMGGGGAVRLSMLHPKLFCAAGSWGGGMWRGADAILAGAEQGADTLRANHFGALLVNGQQDRPEAYDALAKKFQELKIPCDVVIIPDTPHNLGLYYQRSGDRMAEFLGQQLSR